MDVESFIEQESLSESDARIVRGIGGFRGRAPSNAREWYLLLNAVKEALKSDLEAQLRITPTGDPL